MADGIGLVADEVIEAVGGVGVDEAVANPFSGACCLADLCDEFECGLDAFFVGFTVLETREVCFAGVLENVEAVFASEGDKFAGLGPVDLEKQEQLAGHKNAMNVIVVGER